MAAEFLTPLRTEQIGARRWMLTDDLVFRSERYRGIVIAPRGMQTDFASIPRVFWIIAPKNDLYDGPACIHDGAYGNSLVTENGDRIHAIKPVGDSLFHEAMIVMKVPMWRANMMFKAVDVFGNPAGHPLANASRPTDLQPWPTPSSLVNLAT